MVVRVDRLDHLGVPEQGEDMGPLIDGVVGDEGQLRGIAQVQRAAQLPAEPADQRAGPYIVQPPADFSPFSTWASLLLSRTLT